jgi:predicted acetyltransferase
VAPGRDGQVDRDADWWRHFLLGERGSGPPQVFLVDGPEGPDGWAVLTVSSDVSVSEVRTSVQVVDWGASSEAGWRSLLTLAAGFSSLEASVHWKGPDPEPLALLVAEQDIRQLRQERWMARVVDVPGAFTARGYPSWLRGRITVGVADDICPWVDGTWTIEVDGGEGKAVRVGDDAAVTTTAAGLAALFAGYHDPRDLATLGVVRGLGPAEVEFLQAMHTGPRPWSPDFY